MPLHFTAEVDGIQVFDRRLNRVAQGLSDFRPYWPEAAKVIYDFQQRLFRSSGSTGAHGTWPDLSEAYEEQRAKRFTPFPFPLHRTGDLERSLGGQSRPHAVYRDEPLSLTIGTDLTYARHHMKPYKNRPARRPIDPTRKDWENVLRAIRQALNARIGGGGSFGVPPGVEFLD